MSWYNMHTIQRSPPDWACRKNSLGLMNELVSRHGIFPYNQPITWAMTLGWYRWEDEATGLVTTYWLILKKKQKKKKKKRKEKKKRQSRVISRMFVEIKFRVSACKTFDAEWLFYLSIGGNKQLHRSFFLCIYFATQSEGLVGFGGVEGQA